jgi:hypothetical protein
MYISDPELLLVVLAFNVSASILSKFVSVPIVFAAVNVIVSPSRYNHLFVPPKPSLILPAFFVKLLFSMDPPVASKSMSQLVVFVVSSLILE